MNEMIEELKRLRDLLEDRERTIMALASGQKQSEVEALAEKILVASLACDGLWLRNETAFRIAEEFIAERDLRRREEL